MDYYRTVFVDHPARQWYLLIDGDSVYELHWTPSDTDSFTLELVARA